jgi:predicted amidohydrolase
MNVVCLQPKIHQTREKCYQHVESLIKQVLEVNHKPDLICLPERWVPLDLKDLEKNLQDERGEDYSQIKNLARKYHINILSGAIWEKRYDEIDNKNFITCYFFNSEGEEIGRQDKIHLYTYELKYFQPGKHLKLFKFGKYYFSILICFDMAFYETPRLAAESGADLLISPTQIREEGLYNWNIYLQARALENRIPVMASNTKGIIKMQEIRKFLGKSKIISFKEGPMTPSKLIVKEAPLNAGYVYDDINLEFPKKLRKIRLKEKIKKSSITTQKIG